MINLVTDGADNVVASRLGEVARKATKEFHADSVDQGLILLRLLKEGGFRVVYDQPASGVHFFTGSHKEIKRSEFY